MRWLSVVVLAGCSFEGQPVGGDAAPTEAGVGDAATSDAVVDAPADAPADAPSCPTAYTHMAGGSRYRVVAAPAMWLAAEQDCENDGVGTHLVVAERLDEAGLVDTISSATAWIGASNRRDAAVWRWVTGAVTTTFGSTDSTECGQYTTMHDAFRSVACNDQRGYVCECDGMPADPDAY